jgi:hypothetical protein
MEIIIHIFTLLLIVILQGIGIGLHVMEKIVKLGDAHPDKTRQEIQAIFFKEDWDTLRISFLIVILDLVVHIIILVYAPAIAADKYLNVPFELWSFLVALVLGYAGQRLIYRFLGTAETFLNKKVDDHLK